LRSRCPYRETLVKALVIHQYGDGSVAGIENVPAPVPGPSEVLVRVRAASINPVDWKVRAGTARIFTGSRFPKVLGVECAGEVVQTGDIARQFAPGMPVVLLAGVRRLGTFAEFACTSMDTVYPITGGIPFEQASCLPIAGLTALQSLRDHGRIAAGRKVLVNGAAGGVGHFAVQIAKIFGAEVTGVCSGKNRDFVRDLGADQVIDYTNEDFTLGGVRYDLIFDAVSARSFGECRRVLAPSGVYVNTLPDRTLIAQLFTSFLPGKKARSMWVKPSAGDMAWMMEQIAAGRVRVMIDRTYPVDQIADAFARSEEGHARGKIVISMA
jgi:NADPH:quinone reductase-like Zn-dependent oxidoreductase